MPWNTTEPLGWLVLALVLVLVADVVLIRVWRRRREPGRPASDRRGAADQEVLARQAQVGEARMRASHFQARKTVEDFDFTYQTSVRQQVVLHLATLSFIACPSRRLGRLATT